MIVTVHIKDPDGFSDSVTEAVKESRPEGLSDEEWDAVLEQRQESVSEEMKRWVKYGECCTLQFDTKAGTAVVLPKE